MKKEVLIWFACLLFVTSTIAQSVPGACGNTQNNSNSPRMSSHHLVGDGNHTLGQTYNNTACGLDYVQASARVTTRYSNVLYPPLGAGPGFPFSLVISGIPACYVVDRAYLYWDVSYMAGSSTTPTVSLTNPSAVTNNYSGLLMGSDIQKCWAETGTRGFRADVTAAITGTGNGTYTINDIVGNTSWEVDGATLIIIYKNTAATWEGSLIIDDGEETSDGGAFSFTVNGFTACGAGSNADAFMITADFQDNLATTTFTPTMNGSTGTFDKLFWNFADVPTTVTLGQTSAAYSVTDAGDCYAVCACGLYFQTTTCATCSSPVLTLTTTSTPASCSACIGTATVTATGGITPYTYSWNTVPIQTTVTATGLCAGTYIVSVTDGSGCLTSTASVTVAATSMTPVTLSPTTATICPGSSVTLTAGGVVSYSWTPALGLSATTGSTVIATPAATTTYIVTGTDASGCTSTSSCVITVNTTLVVTTTASANPICAGASTDLTASGATTYLWSTSSTANPLTVTPPSTTTYTVTGTTAGCTGSSSITVTVNPIPVVTVSASPSGICEGSSSTLTAAGATTYTWSGGGTTNPYTITPISTITYIVTGTSSGCTATASTTVTVNPIPVITVTSTDENCGQSNGTATATPSGTCIPGYTYTWSCVPTQTTQTATHLPAGNYSVTVSCSGCATTGSTIITNLPGPSITITSSTNTTCGLPNGGAITSVTGNNPPYNFNWSNGQSTANLLNVTGGTYTVTLTDAVGCTATNTVTIAPSTGPSATATSQNEICSESNGTATVTAVSGTTPYSYLWSNHETAQTATNLTAGGYFVTVTDAAGCITTTFVNVYNTPGPTAGMSAEPTIVSTLNDLVHLFDNSSGNVVNWQWSFGDGSLGNGNSVYHSYPNVGSYLVTLIVTDNNGCTDTVSDTIKVKDIFAFYIPNAFTPNNDGSNDFFTPEGNNVDPKNYNEYIFDRWGNEIFHTTKWTVISGNEGEAESWNGTKNNSGDYNSVIMGTYVYRITCREIEGVKHEYIGKITIIP